MAKHLFSDNASSLLAASINDTDLTIQVQNGFGALYPNPGAGEDFYVTLENDDGDIEIVRIQSRSVDLLTVATAGRGQAGTSAQSWTNGQARVELRLNSAIMESFIQREGDTMEGDLDMDDNELQNADIQDSSFEGGEIINTPIRGVSGDTSNQIVVPTNGTRATVGGKKILAEDDGDLIQDEVFVTGMVMLWFGAAVDCPAGWAICNGSNGTPDLRNRVPIGAGDTYAVNDSGGAASVASGSNGAHTHTVTSGPHTLTEAEMPAHTHSVGMHVFVDEADNGTPIRYMVETGSTATGSTGGGQAHTHPDGTADSQGAHTHTVATLPPYRALHFIMRL